MPDIRSLAAKKTKLGGYDQTLADMGQQVEVLVQARAAAEMEIKRADHKVTRAATAKRDAARVVESLLASHPWLPAERAYLGKAGGAFDFKERNPDVERNRLKELQKAQEKLSKNVNMKV